MNISALFAKAATNPTYVPKYVEATSVSPGGANTTGQTAEEISAVIFNRKISIKIFGSTEDLQREANDNIIRAVQAAGGDWNAANRSSPVWSDGKRARAAQTLSDLKAEFGENPVLSDIIDRWLAQLETQNRLAENQANQIAQQGISVGQAKGIIDKHGWPKVMSFTDGSISESGSKPPAVAETTFVLNEIQRSSYHAFARLRELEEEFLNSLVS